VVDGTHSPTYTPTDAPTAEPSAEPTPTSYTYGPSSTPTTYYSKGWSTNTTIAVTIGAFIGGVSVIMAGYCAYTRGFFDPDLEAPGKLPVGTPSSSTKNPTEAAGEGKPLLSAPEKAI